MCTIYDLIHILDARSNNYYNYTDTTSGHNIQRILAKLYIVSCQAVQCKVSNSMSDRSEKGVSMSISLLAARLDAIHQR